MKRSLVLASCVVITVIAFVAMLRHQEARVAKGELIILEPKEGLFRGGPVFVDLPKKTITSKVSVFPITLWEDEKGDVYSRRDMVAGRAYVVVNLLASDDEVALYRKYFPSC